MMNIYYFCNKKAIFKIKNLNYNIIFLLQGVQMENILERFFSVTVWNRQKDKKDFDLNFSP